MELEKFVKDFANQFDDSLIAFTVIAMVKVEYDKTVTGAELRHCNTVEDLFNLVAAK